MCFKELLFGLPLFSGSSFLSTFSSSFFSRLFLLFLGGGGGAVSRVSSSVYFRKFFMDLLLRVFVCVCFCFF